MYVMFLFFTPLLLSASWRYGWRTILACSGLVWLLAQFGLRDLTHHAIVQVTHLHIPLQETGAFNLFAWQAVWIGGLWLGAQSAMGIAPLRRIPSWCAAVAGAVCLFFHWRPSRMAGVASDAAIVGNDARQVADWTVASFESAGFHDCFLLVAEVRAAGGFD